PPPDSDTLSLHDALPIYIHVPVYHLDGCFRCSAGDHIAGDIQPRIRPAGGRIVYGPERRRLLAVVTQAHDRCDAVACVQFQLVLNIVSRVMALLQPFNIPYVSMGVDESRDDPLSV